MKLAITTASGQLGSVIIKHLVSQLGSNNIVGIARTPKKAEHLGVEIRKGDYNSKKEFVKALHDIEVVLIVSGMDHPDNRIIQHRNIIEAAKVNGVRKIVYTSIIGKDGQSNFDAIVNSNRQTEKDIQQSGLEWAIGRNGLYIEPDIEYLENYKKTGKISNCASDGKCSYTTRNELAFAYSQLILNDDKNGKTFALCGEAITQEKLTDFINSTFGTNLIYESMSTKAYLEFQKNTNGEFLGPIIAGIYTKIRNGEFQIKSDYEMAADRPHISWQQYFKSLE